MIFGPCILDKFQRIIGSINRLWTFFLLFYWSFGGAGRRGLLRLYFRGGDTSFCRFNLSIFFSVGGKCRRVSWARLTLFARFRRRVRLGTRFGLTFLCHTVRLIHSESRRSGLKATGAIIQTPHSGVIAKSRNRLEQK